MYQLRTHVLVIGMMTGMMADYYGQNTVGGVSVLATFFLLHIL